MSRISRHSPAATPGTALQSPLRKIPPRGGLKSKWKQDDWEIGGLNAGEIESGPLPARMSRTRRDGAAVLFCCDSDDAGWRRRDPAHKDLSPQFPSSLSSTLSLAAADSPPNRSKGISIPTRGCHSATTAISVWSRSSRGPGEVWFGQAVGP